LGREQGLSSRCNARRALPGRSNAAETLSNRNGGSAEFSNSLFKKEAPHGL
jgi:hypothetical protein